MNDTHDNPEQALFACRDLHIEVNGKSVVKGVNLTLRAGEKAALMGPNGSGKSTLANAVAGHPNYTITRGEVWMQGQNITHLAADEKARKGLFLAFQYPVAIPGVSVANFLRSAVNARRGAEVPIKDFRKELMSEMQALEIDKAFAGRYLNEGFSGGEKKRVEILQMALLKPSVMLLDETDSGLDIDALRTVAEGIVRIAGPTTGTLLVTHYQRLLNYVKPDTVHVFMDGRIVRTGGPELALELEERGYEWIEREVFAEKEA